MTLSLLTPEDSIDDNVIDQVIEPSVETKEPEIVQTEPTNDPDEIDNDTLHIESNVYMKTAQSWVDAGLVDLNLLKEEDYEFEEWNEGAMTKFMNAVLESQKVKEEDVAKKTAQDTFDYVMDKMSDITRKGFEFEKNNPELSDVKDFYKQLLYEADITNLNPSDAYEAEKILSEYYKAQGETVEEARERISNLKDVIAEATKIKPKLDKKVAEIATQKIEEQNQIAAYELSQKKNLSTRLDTVLSEKSLDGIPLDNELRGIIKSIIVEDEFQVNIKGKEVTVGGAEYLMLHHKYSQKGDLKHLAKALIYLQEPELFEKHIQRKIETTETNRFIKEHRQSAIKKIGIKPSDNSKPATQSLRMGLA